MSKNLTVYETEYTDPVRFLKTSKMNSPIVRNWGAINEKRAEIVRDVLDSRRMLCAPRDTLICVNFYYETMPQIPYTTIIATAEDMVILIWKEDFELSEIISSFDRYLAMVSDYRPFQESMSILCNTIFEWNESKLRNLICCTGSSYDSGYVEAMRIIMDQGVIESCVCYRFRDSLAWRSC